jgi:hypothetical protein
MRNDFLPIGARPHRSDSDQLLACVNCGEDFLWTAGEQRFFADRGFTPPRRCKSCREQRRAERALLTE